MAGYAAAQASPPSTTLTAGQDIPLLTHIPPLLWLRRLRVIPFLGLDVVHRRGALGAAWSMWSRNEFQWTWTVRGEADSLVHGRSKEVPPYYVQNNYSST